MRYPASVRCMTANTRGFGRTGVPEADLILEAARGLRRAWSEGLVDHDLSPHESRALRVIARRCGGEEGAPRLADLATALRIAPRSATEVVDRLVSHGLAVRQPSPTDRRAIEVVATEAGLAAASAVERAWTESATRFLAPLNEEERADLSALLRRLTTPSE